MSNNPMLDQVVQQATEAGGGFFSNLLGAPVRALGGLGQGALNGVLGKGLWATAAVAGVLAFAPDLVSGVLRAVGQEGLATRLASFVGQHGILGLLGTSAAIGGGASAAWGGLTGMLGSLGGDRQNAPDQGSGMGALVGGGLAIAAVTAVAIGAVKLNGITLGGDHDAPTAPPPTPGTPGARARV